MATPFQLDGLQLDSFLDGSVAGKVARELKEIRK